MLQDDDVVPDVRTDAYTKLYIFLKSSITMFHYPYVFPPFSLLSVFAPILYEALLILCLSKTQY